VKNRDNPEKEEFVHNSRQLVVTLLCLTICTVSMNAAEIHDAASANNMARVTALLNEDPSLLNVRDADGMTPLNLAAVSGNSEIASLLLTRGADIQIGDMDNSKPIHCAAISGNIQIAELLLKNGARVNEQDNNGTTPLAFAIGRRHIDMVRYLLEKGADVRLRNSDGMTPLFYAGTPEIAALILDKGADIDVRSNDGTTPLLAAVWRGRSGLVRLLLEKGADPNLFNDAGLTPLFALNGESMGPIAQMLIEKGAQVNIRNDQNETPLHNIAWTGSVETVELMLSHGADVNAKSDFGMTPLCMAAMCSAEITRYLLSKGATVNPLDPANKEECPCPVGFQTPLHCAVRSDSISTVKVLTQNGALLNVTDAQGMTPLHMAVSNGNIEIAKYLLDNGAVLNVKEGQYGSTEIHIAAATGQKDIAALLIENKIDINAKDNEGKTPLYYAAYHGFNGIRDMLLEHSDAPGQSKKPKNYLDLLSKKLKKSEALIWHLGHSGWAIKTQNHFLVFDYNATARSIPSEASLSSGYIIPSQIKDENVTVFATHGHGDHYDPAIFGWKNEVTNIEYALGFNPRDLDHKYTYAAPRTTTTVDGVTVTSIRSNDSGAGFLVEVDGLTIFHLGDHANGSMDMSGDYTAEIEAIAGTNKNIDLVFGPILGCSLGTPESVQLGAHYAIETLNPKVFIPMHSGNATYRYRDFVQEAAGKNHETQLIYATNKGDRFIYRDDLVKKIEGNAF
jgi:ankyrin repeat protein/L-ascorbate metabolism protein UlaG (beta-lactamase superfamily)